MNIPGVDEQLMHCDGRENLTSLSASRHGPGSALSLKYWI